MHIGQIGQSRQHIVGKQALKCSPTSGVTCPPPFIIKVPLSKSRKFNFMYNIIIRLDDRFISTFVFPLIPGNGTFGILYTNKIIPRLRRSPLILQQCPIFILP